MKYFGFGFFLLFFGVSTVNAESTKADYCEILDLDRNLVGVVTPEGKIARKIDSTTAKYEVEALTFPDGTLKLVQSDGGRLVLNDMGKTDIIGHIYDYGENYLGRIKLTTIQDERGFLHGYFRGCESLDWETQTRLIAAGASRLILFEFDYHEWDYESSTDCKPQAMCRW